MKRIKVNKEFIEDLKEKISDVKLLRVSFRKESIIHKKDIIVIDYYNRIEENITNITSYGDDSGIIYGHKIHTSIVENFSCITCYTGRAYLPNWKLDLIEILYDTLKTNLEYQIIYDLEDLNNKIFINVKTLKEIKKLIKEKC